MDPDLEKLQAALDAATPEQRTLAAGICRAVLAVLDAKPATAPPPPPASVPPRIANPLAGLPVDHLLPLAIGKLRSMVPADKLAAAPPDVASVLKSSP